MVILLTVFLSSAAAGVTEIEIVFHRIKLNSNLGWKSNEMTEIFYLFNFFYFFYLIFFILKGGICIITIFVIK
jgi:hypothetical protein